MRFRTLLVALLVMLGVSGSDARADAIYVLSQSAATLTVLDSETDAIERTLVLPSPAPAGLALDQGQATAFVTHPDAQKISVIDLVSWKVTKSFDYPGMPFGIAAGGNGRIYVADWNGSSVAQMDAATGVVERSVEVGRAPALLALTPDGRTLVAANRESDSVSVIDVGAFAVKATLGVGRAPFALGISPDGRRVVAGAVQGGSASVINLAGLGAIATKRTGAAPYGVAFTPDGRSVLVVNQQSGTVAILDGGLHALSPPIKVGSYPEGVAVTGDSRKAYVANWFSDDVSVIDLLRGVEVLRITCASGPRAIVAARSR